MAFNYVPDYGKSQPGTRFAGSKKGIKYLCYRFFGNSSTRIGDDHLEAILLGVLVTRDYLNRPPIIQSFHGIYENVQEGAIEQVGICVDRGAILGKTLFNGNISPFEFNLQKLKIFLQHFLHLAL